MTQEAKHFRDEKYATDGCQRECLRNIPLRIPDRCINILVIVATKRLLTISLCFSLRLSDVVYSWINDVNILFPWQWYRYWIYSCLSVLSDVSQSEFANRGDISHARQITVVSISVCLTSASLSLRVLITRKYARTSLIFFRFYVRLLTSRPVIFECNCYATRSASEREVSCISDV